MKCDDAYPALERHVREFFADHRRDVFSWNAGPIKDMLPRLRVVRLAPGPRSELWVYISLGTWEVNHDDSSGLEFIVLAPEESPRHVELLAMTAHYHHGQTLGKWHTFPIGRPWLPDSALDHVLVSPPYPFGPEFEVCEVLGGHVHFFWLLPITASEREFKVQNGVEALEQRLEDNGAEFWNPKRPAVA